MREYTIMARHQRMPTSKAGYTYAVEPTANNQTTCIEEESIYGRFGAEAVTSAFDPEATSANDIG